MGAHVWILQLENVAYSNPPEIFVNDLSHTGRLSLRIPLKEQVLTAGKRLKAGCRCGLSLFAICGKAEDNGG
jgi:hypothetical protein